MENAGSVMEKCPICRADVPSVGDTLSDPITDHFRSGLCTPEKYEFDVLDLSAFHPTNIFVLLDTLGKIPNLRHLWLKLPCPVSQRPAATVYERFTSMLYQEISVRKHVSDSNFLSWLGFSSAVRQRGEAEPKDTLRSSSVQVHALSTKPQHYSQPIDAKHPVEAPVSSTSIESERQKAGDVYEVLLKSTSHVCIRCAILQVPFEEITETSRLLISFTKVKDLTDSTHEIDLLNILRQGGIFLSERMLLEHLHHTDTTTFPARTTNPTRIRAEQGLEEAQLRQYKGTERQQSASLSGCSYEHMADHSSSINYYSEKRVSPGTGFHRFAYTASGDAHTSDVLISDRGHLTIQSADFEGSSSLAPAFELSYNTAGESPAGNTNDMDLNHLISAKALLHNQDSPQVDCLSFPEDKKSSLAQKSEVQASPSLEQSEQEQKGQGSDIQGTGELRQSKSFFSYVLKSIIRQFKGEDSATKLSIMSGLLDSIRYDLPTIVVRRLMSIGTRPDYLPLLSALLPSLKTIDGVSIAPTKQREYVKEIQSRYSFPHYLILERLEDKASISKKKKTDRAAKSASSIDSRGTFPIMRNRPSLYFQELEGQYHSWRFTPTIMPLDLPARTAKKLCARHISRIIEPRSYSIFNVSSLGSPFRLSTTPPELPTESTFSLMSRFGRPSVLRASPYNSDIAIGTDQGDVFVIDGSAPLVESMHRYVTITDSSRRDYVVDIPFMRRRKTEGHSQDSIVALTWLSSSANVIVAATSYGELLFGHMLYDYSHSAAHKQRLKSHSIDVGRTILDFALRSSFSEVYSVAQDALRVVNYDLCTLVNDIPITNLLPVSANELAPRAPQFTKCSYSLSSSLLGLGTLSGQILLYDVRTLSSSSKPVLTLDKFSGLPVESITFGLDGHVILSAALDGRVLHYDVRSDHANPAASVYNFSSIRSAYNHTKAAFINTSKKFLVSQHDTGVLKVFDYPSGKQFYEIYMNPLLKWNNTNIIDFDELPMAPFTYACVTRTNTVSDVGVISLINSSKGFITASGDIEPESGL